VRKLKVDIDFKALKTFNKFLATILKNQKNPTELISHKTISRFLSTTNLKDSLNKREISHLFHV
jgi:hypothetical protein